MNDEAKLWKRGDVHPDTGRVFLCRQKSCKDGLRFVTVDEFEKRKKYGSSYAKSSKYIERQKIARNTDEKRAKRNEYNKKFKKTEKQNERILGYQKKRRLEDPVFCISGRIRARLNESLRIKGYTKRSKLTEILGCSFDEIKTHIESQFLDGMNWENRNMWEIDHIIPISSAKTEKEVIALNHYKNIRPLWAIDNRKKGCKMPDEMDAEYSARDDWK